MLDVRLDGIDLQFKTSPCVFSPRQVDRGTLAMLSQVECGADEKALDLGCGYGVVGIFLAKKIGEDKVVMTDIDEQAVCLAKENALINNVSGIRIYQSNGFSNLDETGFTLILSNPPYHSDFSVPKHFIEKGFNRLVLGGRMVMVTKRKEWYKNKFISIFGGVKIKEVDNYYVFTAEKRRMEYADHRRR